MRFGLNSRRSVGRLKQHYRQAIGRRVRGDVILAGILMGQS